MLFRIVLIGAVAAAFSTAAKLEVDLAVEASIKSRLESGLVKAKQRQGAIHDLFAEVGCAAEEQKVDRNAGNVICILPGQTASTIVVGGHFDFVDRGTGIIDDWSGTALLPSLYEALKSRPHQHTYVFVAFAEEERGLIGSSVYVRKLSREQREHVSAFVNLECLGMSPLKVWTTRAAPILVTNLLAIADALDTRIQGVNVEKVGDDDTHPFLSAHMPVITLHSLTQGTFRMLHTERDRLDAMHFDDYYKSYKLIAYYLAYLDMKIK